MNRQILFAAFVFILLSLAGSTVIAAQAVEPDKEVQSREAEQKEVVIQEEPWEKAGREIREAFSAVSAASMATWDAVEKQTKQLWKKIIGGSAGDGDKESGKESGESGKGQGAPENQTFWQRSKKAVNDMYNNVIIEIQKLFSSEENERDKEKKEKTKV